MNVGLPGTGIGGLFYIIMALMMPFHEAVLTIRGQSNWTRWRKVGVMQGIAFGIIGSLWGTVWLLTNLIPTDLVESLTGSTSFSASSLTRLGVPPAMLGLLALPTLLVVLLAIEGMRLQNNHRRPT
ncbi:MAG TPA: hypothetical protein VFR55_08765 [Dehalococcoidia bacterium]|nr:hypothetical protein [Dehalococcoidia bacterium]